MDTGTKDRLRKRLDLEEAGYRMDPDDFDSTKSFKEIALDVINALPEDASMERVTEQLRKASYLVLDHATYKSADKPRPSQEETISSEEVRRRLRNG